MVLDPEKTLEIEIARISQPRRATTAIAIGRGHDSAHRTIQMLIALVAAMVVLMFLTN